MKLVLRLLTLQKILVVLIFVSRVIILHKFGNPGIMLHTVMKKFMIVYAMERQPAWLTVTIIPIITINVARMKYSNKCSQIQIYVCTNYTRKLACGETKINSVARMKKTTKLIL